MIGEPSHHNGHADLLEQVDRWAQGEWVVRAFDRRTAETGSETENGSRPVVDSRCWWLMNCGQMSSGTSTLSMM